MVLWRGVEVAFRAHVNSRFVSGRVAVSVCFFLLGMLLAAPSGWAQEVGHYVPGVANIRDFTMPPKGCYYVQYNSFYSSDTFKNSNGIKVDTVTIGDTIIMVELDVDVFSITPTLICNTGLKVLGAEYAFYAALSVANSSLGATLTIRDQGLTVNESQVAFGDLYLQPLWLGWRGKRYDLSAGYGFYAPLGQYTPRARDNVGLGFWSHEFRGSGTYYVTEKRTTALMLTVNYELNADRKQGFDLKPGDYIAAEWGLSQYLSERLEVGFAGSHIWQITDDTGADRRNTVHDRVHGMGFQAGYWPIKQKLNLTGRLLWEFGARDRLEGTWLNIALTYIF